MNLMHPICMSDHPRNILYTVLLFLLIGCSSQQQTPARSDGDGDGGPSDADVDSDTDSDSDADPPWSDGSDFGEAGTDGDPDSDGEPDTTDDDTDAGCARYNIGAGMADITGPLVESSTGYNSPGETMNGLSMRLYSRAFAIESPCNDEIVVLVAADMLHMFQSIKLGVVKKLAAEGLADVFDATNVMLTATHTHAAPSNYSWYTLYNLFNGVVGFDRLHYNIVVQGITDSIISAYENMTPGVIRIAGGEVEGAAHNRSLLAYDNNIDAKDFDETVDRTMTLLKLEGEDGEEIGLINWFATHGTSLGMDNHHVHGDNKGWASYRFEEDRKDGFVAAFAQAAMGDVSPNEPDPEDVTLPFRRPNDLDPGLTPFDNPKVHGNRQYETAVELYDSAKTLLNGEVRFRHTYVNFNHVEVDPGYIGDYSMPWDDDVDDARTGIACVGAGFLAGDEEGAPVDFAEEGEVRHRFVDKDGEWVKQKYDLKNLDAAAKMLGVLWPAAKLMIGTDAYGDIHKEKYVLLPVGKIDDMAVPLPNNKIPWVPNIIPIQIFTVGQLAIVATPFELTVMAARRLKATLQSTLSEAGITGIVIAAIANSYGHYQTTREEYAAQNFEGAFNLYGPWSAAAFRQEADRLAQDIVAERASEPGPTPRDLSKEQLVETDVSEFGVVNDGANAGTIETDALESYSRGDTVSVVFHGAHPRTMLERRLQGTADQVFDEGTFSYLKVQMRSGSGATWKTIAADGHPDTLYTWRRVGGQYSPNSRVTIDWVTDSAEPGIYRVVYYGIAKTPILPNGKFKRASGEFEVREN